MPNTSFKYVLEIACFDVASCVLAQNSGADRIEFCANYLVGGITPKHEDILKAKQLLHIPLHVIIRPRGGNFIYTTQEIETMKSDILFCKQHKIDGVVFGLLTADNRVDEHANKELINLCGDMSSTFHRAIDECENINNSITDLINLGFKKVLSSGGKQNALEGINTLKSLQKQFGNQIHIIPGGGIRSNNIKLIAKETNCSEFHSAAIINNILDVEELKKIKEHIT